MVALYSASELGCTRRQEEPSLPHSARAAAALGRRFHTGGIGSRQAINAMLASLLYGLCLGAGTGSGNT